MFMCYYFALTIVSVSDMLTIYTSAKPFSKSAYPLFTDEKLNIIFFIQESTMIEYRMNYIIVSPQTYRDIGLLHGKLGSNIICSCSCLWFSTSFFPMKSYFFLGELLLHSLHLITFAQASSISVVLDLFVVSAMDFVRLEGILLTSRPGLPPT